MHCLTKIVKLRISFLFGEEVIIGSLVEVIRMESSKEIEIEQERVAGGGVVTVTLLNEKIPLETVEVSLDRMTYVFL